jgi:histidinol-phosphate/aromatic aminotransferase/cobyric acid decarboxylase-like protein
MRCGLTLHIKKLINGISTQSIQYSLSRIYNPVAEIALAERAETRERYAAKWHSARHCH